MNQKFFKKYKARLVPHSLMWWGCLLNCPFMNIFIQRTVSAFPHTLFYKEVGFIFVCSTRKL